MDENKDMQIRSSAKGANDNGTTTITVGKRQKTMVFTFWLFWLWLFSLQ